MSLSGTIKWKEIFMMKGERLEVLELLYKKNYFSNLQNGNELDKQDLLSIAKHCRNLKELYLYKIHFEYETLLEICENLSQLKTLILEDCTSNSWLSLSSLSSVTHLALERCSIDSVEEMKIIVKNFKNLVFLNVCEVPCMNFDLLELICEIPTLKTLRFKNVYNIPSQWRPNRKDLRIIF